MNDRIEGASQVTFGRPGDLSTVRIGNLGICDIACQDPALAYALLQPIIHGERVGVYNGLEIVNLIGEFTSGTADQTIPARQSGVISGDFWLRKVTYTVRRPNAFAGSILKAQSDHFNKENPNVDFQLLINTGLGCKYVIASDPTPLENIEIAFECCPVQIVLGCSASFAASFTLNRALASDEVPYEVVISLYGMVIPGIYASLSRVKCLEALTAWRILPSAA